MWAYNPRFIIESGFKSRLGYNGAHTVLATNFIFLPNNINSIFVQKVFKGGNYSRAETIHRNTVSINFQKNSYAVNLKQTISGGMKGAAVLVYGCLACLKSSGCPGY